MALFKIEICGSKYIKVTFVNRGREEEELFKNKEKEMKLEKNI